MKQLDCFALEMGQISCCETSVSNYQPTLSTLQKGKGLNVYGFLVK